MGVDFSHCDFGISYRSFSTFREKLADEAGINLKKMQGYGGTCSWDEIDDPLVPFLSSFDEYGGGEICANKCLSVKRRIEELASRWSPQRPFEKNARDLAFALANGIAKAAFLGEPFYWF